MASLSTYQERYLALIRQRADIDIDIAQLMAECFADGHTIVNLLDMPDDAPVKRKRRKASAPQRVEVGEGHFERMGRIWRTQHADCAIKHRGQPDPEREAFKHLALLVRAKMTEIYAVERAIARLKKLGEAVDPSICVICDGGSANECACTCPDGPTYRGVNLQSEALTGDMEMLDNVLDLLKQQTPSGDHQRDNDGLVKDWNHAFGVWARMAAKWQLRAPTIILEPSWLSLIRSKSGMNISGNLIVALRYVVFDFETASRSELTKVGAWRYASDFSTFILCAACKVYIDHKPQPAFCLSEKQLHALDPRLMELANDPETIFIVHNGGFEQGMWHYHMVPMGYPKMPPERWHDTMAVCAMKALPLGLDAAVSALELPIKKDMEGHKHMLFMCKPHKDSWDHHTPENLQRLYEYCIGDVEAQGGLYHATKALGKAERAVWVEDQYIQQRGVTVDPKFIRACIDVLDMVRIPMTERFRQITGIKPTQREKILNWVNEQGVALGDMKKATLDAMLDPDDEFEIDALDEPLPLHVHEALTLRRALASSSVAKLERMLMCATSDNRVRYTTQYHGARTGRDAGRLMQVQNYPRGELKERMKERQGLTEEALVEAVMDRNLPLLYEIWGHDIFNLIISLLRSCIVADKGKVLCGGDYAGVEARNLLSMAGQHDRVEQMHAGVDVYCENASLIYKRPITKANTIERQTGKNSTLGNGYGLGAYGFQSRFAPNQSIEFAQQVVHSYRNDFAPMVPKFWYGLFAASVNAVWCDLSRTYSFLDIEFRKEGEWLTMRLPSGRKLYYHRPRKATTYTPSGDEKPSWSFMSYQGKRFRRHLAWHGMVTADCIQGSARCMLVAAMLRFRREGLPTIFKVHDELVIEEYDRPDLTTIVQQIMEDSDPWVIERKFKVRAEVEKMLRYQQPKIFETKEQARRYAELSWRGVSKTWEVKEIDDDD
uniref:XRE family transcriptional regulator n=1 Tax=Mycena chlorophos TaxID=658473 RepID=A0ABQ0KW12_MYCCL|nr:XRE family transcriptional regulator [Mycena chlorophos]